MKKESDIPFELTNEQRIYLGLHPVEPTWEQVYFEQKYLYYDGETIRKEIRVKADCSEYYECELNEHTAERRTVLLPKTQRGKPKKMNYTATLSFSPLGVYFHFDRDSVLIGNYTTQTSFYTDNHRDGLPLKEWVERWVAETTPADLRAIEDFKNAKRQRVKFREGDFFAFPIGRRQWGFGRILIDVPQRKKDPEFNAKNNYGLTNLMGKALIIHVYRKVADSPAVDLDCLISCGAFPSQAIMDNRFFYGEYPIIGNRPVRPEEWEPMISYGRSIDTQDPRTVYLQWGLIYKETTVDRFKEFLRDDGGEVNPFRNEAIGFGIHCLSALLGAEDNRKAGNDLRAPENDAARRQIFRHFGLDPDLSYAENLKLTFRG